MTHPHDNWAFYYDWVYEQSFPGFYQSLTDKTLRVVQDFLPTGTVLDFGAGTGRLAIPLARLGYRVTAVERSFGMIDQLKNKQEVGGYNISCFNGAISEYSGECGDLALSVFTVLSYLTTKEELSASIANIAKHLNPGGYWLFDLPSEDFFSPGKIFNLCTDQLKRDVWIKETDVSNVKIYHEISSGNFNGRTFEYEDQFPIRFWLVEDIVHLLRGHNFVSVNFDSSQFRGTGSSYHLFQKQ